MLSDKQEVQHANSHSDNISTPYHTLYRREACAQRTHTHTQQGCHLWPQSEAPPLQQQMLTQVPPVAPGAVCAAGVSPSCSMLLALAVLTKVLPAAGCRGRVHVTHTAGAR
jgi:hypothetical protein